MSWQRQQAVWTLKGGRWGPKRGIHRGLQCSVCGAQEEQMYELDQTIYCAAHVDDIDQRAEQLEIG